MPSPAIMKQTANIMDKPEINIIVISGNTAEPLELSMGGTTVNVNVANSDLEQQQDEDFYTNQVDSFFDAMCDLPPEEEEYWMLCDQREKAGAELRDIVGESSIIQDHITW
ncbi:hypothetical protein [Syntrophomonas wolfei]|jgi:hypothetical protein|uniref:hypothetical protein n=1 Tax=Syntrophomonas wolfei TaxID=863 RepID=UPI0023F36E01|nr:hypothetical protein [Syntrophomonas wolfei]